MVDPHLDLDLHCCQEVKTEQEKQISLSHDQANNGGARWLSGRVLDLRLRVCGLEPHRRHCVVSFSKRH